MPPEQRQALSSELLALAFKLQHLFGASSLLGTSQLALLASHCAGTPQSAEEELRRAGFDPALARQALGQKLELARAAGEGDLLEE
jgi:hypothetical protein